MDEREKSLSAAVTLLREELTSGNAVSHDVMQRLLDVVLTAIGRRNVRALRTAAKRPPMDVRIARVLVSVREHLSERWTIAKMAKIAGMSRAAFIRLFRATTGAPPLTYVTRLRIEAAQALLAETDEAAASIAERVGYGSVYAFSRAFSRLTGKPPVLFRRTARAESARIVGRATMMRIAA
ncbi:MAG TPA: AraC family transcriptional regulator [Polyangiaceae bacterium]|nr:AraC family transcriptional regulator [Polyangiaceae bacterium]